MKENFKEIFKRNIEKKKIPENRESVFKNYAILIKQIHLPVYYTTCIYLRFSMSGINIKYHMIYKI